MTIWRLTTYLTIKIYSLGLILLNVDIKTIDLMSIEPKLLLTEVILSRSLQSLGKIYLDWHPQPGNSIEFKGKNYVILERHHHYQYKIGGYCLQKISLHVQESFQQDEKTLVRGRWVVGDASCRFNARSEIIRCAVNPPGPCHNCRYYETSGEIVDS